MKKIRTLVVVLLAIAAAIGFMGCPGSVDDSSPSYTGTVKVKIFNNADVPLTVTCITEYSDSYPVTTLGTYEQEASISVNGNREFEIPCSASRSYDASETKINCYCTSGASVVYPYVGSINGTSITIDTYSNGTTKQTNYDKFSHSNLALKSSNPDTITVMYNFVKATNGAYVLCKVE